MPLTISELRVLTCRDCGVQQGELHQRGCLQEVCARCGGQPPVCGCNAKRRLPFVAWANVCARCGQLDPEMFDVPDRVWRHYIDPSRRSELVCEPCFEQIAELIDGGKYMAAHGAPAVIGSPEFYRRHQHG